MLTFGAAIRRQRRDLNMTQTHVAERVGISAVYVTLLEQDKRTPSLAVVWALAAVLNLDARELFPLSNPGAAELLYPASESAGVSRHMEMLTR